MCETIGERCATMSSQRQMRLRLVCLEWSVAWSRSAISQQRSVALLVNRLPFAAPICMMVSAGATICDELFVDGLKCDLQPLRVEVELRDHALQLRQLRVSQKTEPQSITRRWSAHHITGQHRAARVLPCVRRPLSVAIVHSHLHRVDRSARRKFRGWPVWR